MAKFKGTGSVCTIMGQPKAEFINGEIDTNDQDTIDFLIGKGYTPEPEVKPLKKTSVKE